MNAQIQWGQPGGLQVCPRKFAPAERNMELEN